MSDVFAKLQVFLKNRIPFVASLLLIMIFYIPLNVDSYHYLSPYVALLCVYYWTAHKSELFGYFSAFLLGLVSDSYSSAPMGTDILMLLTAVLLIRFIKMYVQPTSFWGGWLLFAFVALIVYVLKFVILALYYERLFSLLPNIANFAVTIIFYPMIAYIMMQIQDKFLTSEISDE